MARSDVVITGIGCISPLGVSPDEMSAALREGRSAIGEIAGFDASGYPCQFGAEVLNLELSDFVESSKTYIDRTSAYVLAACSSALEEAHWGGDESVGLILGTAWGCMDSLQLFAEKLVSGNPRFVPPLPFTHSYTNAPNSLAAIEFKLRGFNACLANGHVAGASAIEYACRRIALGKEKRLLAGGGESLSESVFHAYGLRGGLSASGQPRPYDPASDGMVLGEGAAVFALEDAELAREWSDPVFARVLGWASCTAAIPSASLSAGPAASEGQSAVRRTSGTGQEGSLADGIARAMHKALADAGIAPDAVDLILGAACGLPELDSAEAEAIRSVFGSALPAVTSIKGMVGEGMGSGGPMSLAAALACLEGHFAPPVSAGGPPALEGLNLITGAARDLRVHTAIVNAVDPGGACVCLVVAAP